MKDTLSYEMIIMILLLKTQHTSLIDYQVCVKKAKTYSVQKIYIPTQTM